MKKKRRVTIPLDLDAYNNLVAAYSFFLRENSYISFSFFLAQKLSEAAGV